MQRAFTPGEPLWGSKTLSDPNDQTGEVRQHEPSIVPVPALVERRHPECSGPTGSRVIAAHVTRMECCSPTGKECREELAQVQAALVTYADLLAQVAEVPPIDGGNAT